MFSNSRTFKHFFINSRTFKAFNFCFQIQGLSRISNISTFLAMHLNHQTARLIVVWKYTFIILQTQYIPTLIAAFSSSRNFTQKNEVMGLNYCVHNKKYKIARKLLILYRHMLACIAFRFLNHCHDYKSLNTSFCLSYAYIISRGKDNFIKLPPSIVYPISCSRSPIAECHNNSVNLH